MTLSNRPWGVYAKQKKHHRSSSSRHVNDCWMKMMNFPVKLKSSGTTGQMFCPWIPIRGCHPVTLQAADAPSHRSRYSGGSDNNRGRQLGKEEVSISVGKFPTWLLPLHGLLHWSGRQTNQGLCVNCPNWKDLPLHGILHTLVPDSTTILC